MRIANYIIVYHCISLVIRPVRKQLESDAAKTEEILKTPQQKGFYFFYFKKSNLDRRCCNAFAGPTVCSSCIFKNLISRSEFSYVS